VGSAPKIWLSIFQTHISGSNARTLQAISCYITTCLVTKRHRATCSFNTWHFLCSRITNLHNKATTRSGNFWALTKICLAAGLHQLTALPQTHNWTFRKGEKRRGEKGGDGKQGKERVRGKKKRKEGSTIIFWPSLRQRPNYGLYIIYRII